MGKSKLGETMAEDTDTSGGRPTKIPPEVFADAVEELGSGTTSEVKDIAEGNTNKTVDDSTARRRLNKLANSGEIVKRQSGSSNQWLSYEAFDAVVSDAKFLREIDDEILTTEEVAEGVGIDRNAACKRLQELADDGEVSSRNEGGGGATLWATG